MSFPRSMMTYTSTVPFFPVTKWKHRSNLEFGNLNYGTLAHVNIVLGGKVFRKEVLDDLQLGAIGALSAIKMCLSSVLNGETKRKSESEREVKGKGRHATTLVCCAAICNNALKRKFVTVYC